MKTSVFESLFNKVIENYWKRLQHRWFLVNMARNFKKNFFDKKPLAASVDLLFLIKSNVGWSLLKRVDLVIVRYYTLLVDTIPTHFCWLTCRNQKLVQRRPLLQRLFVLILTFWQVFSLQLMSILMICKGTCGYLSSSL